MSTADMGGWTLKKKLGVAFGGLLLVGAGVAFYAYWILAGLGGTETGEGIITESYTQTLIEDIPVAIDVTPDGRVFVVETGQFEAGVGDNRFQSFWLEDDLASNSVADREAYIRKWIERGELTEEWFTGNADTVRVLEDTDGDGRGDKATVFAEIRGLLDGVIAGVLVVGKDVLVTSIPRVWKFTDEDGDNRADRREELSYGYGLRTSFIGHDLHGLTRGPEGKVYFSLGDRGYNIRTDDGRHLIPPMDNGRGAVFRMNADGSELEVFATGLRNPQELTFDNYGNLFTGDNNSDGGDEARIVYVVEGGDSGWMSPYQFMSEDDYLRGPWNAEKMWHPYHEGQPAWMVPPIANETRGPSGMTFYPGLGLPARYQEHFFLADYGFTTTRSNILSFAVEPEGAGFTLRDVHLFASNELFIDQDFGYDGKLYAVTASTFANRREILTFHGEKEINDPRLVEVRELFATGFASLSEQHLLELLGHVDQRVRQESQFELASRKVVTPLAAIAADAQQPQLKRIHALWALGQQGGTALEQSRWQDFSAFSDDREVLTQALKVSADAGAQWLARAARSQLSHANARVRYFAAMAAGKFRDAEALPLLVKQLAENNNRDPYLRHALVWALTRITEDNSEAAADLWSHRDSDSKALRLGVLLALRQQEDARLAHFLSDPAPALVVEAARAIHDVPISAALPELAALALTDMPQTKVQAQSGYALHRRVINANLRLGSEASAMALAAYANSAKNPIDMRRLALQALENFSKPPVFDAVLGTHRPLPARQEKLVYAALDRYVPELIRGKLRDEAMQLATAYGRLPLSSSELLELLGNDSESLSNRLSALRGLARRQDAEKELVEGIKLAFASEQPRLRMAALELQVQRAPDMALSRALQLAENGEASVERQHALGLLARHGGEAARKLVSTLLASLQHGELDEAIQLDVLEAAQKLGGEQLEEQLAEYQRQVDAQGMMAAKGVARSGGDVELGKQVFENRGDCLRCHAINGRGGSAGPDLGGVAARYDANYLLEALVEPQASIAPGFGIVSMQLQDGSRVSGLLQGEDEDALWLRSLGSHGEGGATRIPRENIADMAPPLSGMPAMGLVLSTRELRDVMAYLQSLTQQTTSNNNPGK